MTAMRIALITLASILCSAGMVRAQSTTSVFTFYGAVFTQDSVPADTAFVVEIENTTAGSLHTVSTGLPTFHEYQLVVVDRVGNRAAAEGDVVSFTLRDIWGSNRGTAWDTLTASDIAAGAARVDLYSSGTVAVALIGSHLRIRDMAVEISWVLHEDGTPFDQAILRRQEGETLWYDIHVEPWYDSRGYRVLDHSVEFGARYEYALRLTDGGQNTLYSLGRIVVPNVALSLDQNYPNPFNPVTNIVFTLPLRETVQLEIFDVLGRHVRTLVAQEVLPSGSHTRSWNGRDDASAEVSAGIYFCRLRAGSSSITRKMSLLK